MSQAHASHDAYQPSNGPLPGRPSSRAAAPDLPPKLALPLTVLGVWFSPRRTGRRLARRGVTLAVAIHVASLLAACGAVILMGQLFETAPAPGRGPAVVASAFRHVVEGMTVQAATAISTSTVMIVLAILALGEAFYWSFAVGVLGPYMALGLPQRRLVGRAFVAAGYASVWAVPLMACWGASAYLYAVAWGWSGMGAGRWSWAMVCAALLATFPLAGMIGMAMRLARGLGDAIRQDGPADDPLCESCGYNLHATGFDSRCPECGQPASFSRSPIHRCNAWEVRHRGLVWTLRAVLTNPVAFFRTIRTRGQYAAARLFLLESTVLSTLLFVSVLVIIETDPFPVRAMRGNVPFALLRGGVWALAVPTISMFAAGMLAGASRRKGDRLDGRGAMKIACYLSALAVPWAILVGGMMTVLFRLTYVGYTRAAQDRVLTLVWLITIAGLGVWYWIAASRAYQACRWANT